jgi:hypothetical protein
MKTVVSLEEALESLFVTILTRSVTHSTQIIPKIGLVAPAVARHIILGGKSYVDWLPIDHTKKRAEAFLRGGRPFTNITTPQRKALDKVSAIRNVIAHPSKSAKKRFENDVLRGLTLLLSERTPAGYLRSVYRSSPSQTRFEEVQIECLLVMKDLCR